MRRSFNPWLVVMLIILGIFVFNQFNAGGSPREITFTTFTELVDQGRVARITIERNNGVIEGELAQETQVMVGGETQTVRNFRVTAIVTDSLLQRLEENVEQVTIRNPPQWIGFLISVLPILILLAFFWFVFMRAQGGPNQVMQFGQSKAKTYGRENKVSTTFADVAGHAEAKQELKEVVDFLKHPQKYLRIGAEIPKGVLLVGPPGTGKTLLARAVAGEAGVPFLTVSASEFMEMFVGVGASRVRSLFEEARKASPAIIFIDELDALGRARGIGPVMGGHDEKEQTLNQLLSELDGFDPSIGVVLLAATNRPEILDPALLRAGRFDRQVLVDRPDKQGRIAILHVHMRKARLGSDVDAEKVAGITPGFTGADLANLVNEATLLATRRKADAVTMDDFNNAVERIVAGLEKRNRLLNPKEREVVAYHEMGHALVALALPGSDAVHKVSIIPRGVGSLGYTIQRPTEDRFLMTREELENKMAVLLGGRAAEKIVFGHLSTGAADDLGKVTDIARAMVTRYGMSDKLGHVALEKSQNPFLNPNPYAGYPQERDYGEATADAIDAEVRAIVETAFERTVALLTERRDLLEKTARRLLEKETLDESELTELTGMTAPAKTPG